MTLGLYIVEDDVVMAAALILGISGLLFVWWGWFEDRARGRRRCPKCLYDMAGVPGLTCPECGQAGRSERRLRSTHRRRIAALLGLVLILGAFVTPRVMPWYRYGWRRTVPTWAVVQILNATGWPAADKVQGNKWAAELQVRHKQNRLGWGRDGALRGMTRHWTFRYRAKWPAGVPIELWPASGRWYDMTTWMSLLVRNASGDEDSWRSISSGTPPQSFPVGVPSPTILEPLPAGARSLFLDARLERPVTGSNPGSTSYALEWSGRLALPIEIVGTVDEALRPVQSEAVRVQLGSGLRLMAWEVEGTLPWWGALWFDGAVRSPDPKLAIAVRVEILRDGVVVASGAGLVGGPSLASSSLPIMVRVAELVPGDGVALADAAAHRWSVRLIGDGEGALHELGADSYWKGEAEFSFSPGEMAVRLDGTRSVEFTVAR